VPIWFLISLFIIMLIAGIGISYVVMTRRMEKATRLWWVIGISLVEFVLIFGLVAALLLFGLD